MPSWAESRSGGTGSSHPGLNGPELSPVGTKGTRRGCPTWGEYRSGGTGGTLPGMDTFLDLSSKGVKCSRGLHFPSTNLYSWKNSSPDIKRLTKLII